MPSFRTARVIELLSERDGLQRVRISFDTHDDHADIPTGVADRRAYALTQMVGPIAVGDEIVVNTTAVDLKLGTGGWDVVHWNLSRRDWHSPTKEKARQSACAICRAWQRHKACPPVGISGATLSRSTEEAKDCSQICRLAA